MAIPVPGAVPANDDGMGQLRSRIKALQQTATTPDDLARGLQKLMSEKWDASGARIEYEQLFAGSGRLMVPTDRSLARSAPVGGAFGGSGGEPAVSGSISVFGSPLARLGLGGGDSEANNTDIHLDKFRVTPADLVPSFMPVRVAHHEVADELTVVVESDESEESDSEANRHLGCEHYMRNVKVQCVTCQKWYPCRHCHNAAERTHELPRMETKYMLCMLCQTAQPAAGTCSGCGETAARYYCDTCKLWDNNPDNRIYHCPDCGLCRRGEGLGKDLVHCKKCSVCILIQHYSTHRCLPRATDRDCPICFQYMFTSSDSIVAMPCGHYLHQKCYDEYMQHEYRCPICKRSAINMELQWRKLDEAIEQQPMPDEYASSTDSTGSDDEETDSELADQAEYRTRPAGPARTRIRRSVTIICNDCGTRTDVPFHWLGCKCAVCDSYNTDETTAATAAPGRPPERTVSPMLVVGPGRPVVDPNQPAAGPGSWQPMSYLLNWRARRSSNSISDAVSSAQEATSHTHPHEAGRALAQDDPAAGLDADVSFGPLELMQRVVGRSFSPIRNYLFDARAAAVDLAGEDVDGDWDGAEFWGRAGWFLSGDEDDEGDDRGEGEEAAGEEQSGNEDEADEEEDDDDDEPEGRLPGFELTGHR